MAFFFRSRPRNVPGRELERELEKLEKQASSASAGYETQYLTRAGNLCVDAGQTSRALGYFGRPGAVREKPGGHGPVTEADLAVDAMLRERLLAARPDYGWLSEESEDDPARLGAARLFVVDPIDGTRAFVAGQRFWAHSLAVVAAGEAVAGVVHLPMLGRTYAIGYEPDLNETLLARPRRTVLNRAWKWAIWYPLRRSGRFAQLPAIRETALTVQSCDFAKRIRRARSTVLVNVPGWRAASP